MALGVAQTRARLHGAVDKMKMGMTVAEMLMTVLARGKKRDA